MNRPICNSGMKEIKELLISCLRQNESVRVLTRRVCQHWKHDVISKSQVQQLMQMDKMNIKHIHLVYFEPFLPYDLDTLREIATGIKSLRDLENDIDDTISFQAAIA